MKKSVMLLCLLLVLALSLSACGGGTSSAQAAEKISFSQTLDIASIEALEGKTVEIIGYMATISPLDGRYIYLMNMPYQSCPFCVPNTTQLANTMAVFAPSGKSFDFTDRAIRVTGKIELGEYTDDFGYQYNYRIVDASYEEVDMSQISEEYALWQSLAADGVVAEINSMFDYLYFICQWTEIQATFTFEDGSTASDYLYPGDVENYLQDTSVGGYADKAQEGYFDGLIARVRAISETELEDLVAILEQAEAAASYAREELKKGNFSYDEQAGKYVLTNAQELYDRFYEPYLAFSEWLARWEM